MSLYERMLESSNRRPPTDEQLEIARDLGLLVQPEMSLDDVNRLISEAKSNGPPSRGQMQRARELGIVVMPDMTTNDVRELIADANASGPYTQHQLAEALALGITLNDEMSYAEVEALILKAEACNPPFEKQLELCERIGLPIQPGMNRGQVQRMLDYARKNPRFQAAFHANDPVQIKAREKRLRAEFGDYLVEELHSWQQRIGRGQYLIMVRQDDDIMVDVAVVESANIQPGDLPRVMVGIALPLVVQDDSGNDHLEWGTDELISATRFLNVSRLRADLDSGDLNDYWRLVAYGKRNAAKIQAKAE